MIDSISETLKKAYRAIKSSQVTGQQEHSPATYKKYASWKLSHDQIENAFKTIESDQELVEKGKGIPGITSPNCVKYVAHIMKASGLKGLEFGWWPTKPKNLKQLVDEHVQPKKDKKY